MKKTIYALCCIALFGSGACRQSFTSDASGSFEAEEIIVSAEQSGKILSLQVNEGEAVKQGAVVGSIDVSNDQLKKAQVEASIHALDQKTNDPQNQVLLYRKQLEVQEAQLGQLQREKKRLQNLISADAATQKQLDDLNASLDQLQKQMDVTRQQLNLALSNTNTQNRGILSEQEPLRKSVAQIENQISKGQIISPISGLVLTKYAYTGEVTSMGKALFKVANLDTLNLRVYVSGTQLPSIQLGQQVKVLIDDGDKGFREYPGRISWISAKSEFTPKTVQTKDERASLVYAVKVTVKNDGFLKIGMYGEVKFNATAKGE